MIERKKLGGLALESVLATAMKMPGVKINREDFLRKELKKYCDERTIDMAIQYNPAKAGISKNIINKVSETVIDYETNKVSLLSVAASLPSSISFAAAGGAAVADITSYFAFIIRVVQELAYLYGFEEFEFHEDNVDSETMNLVLIFLGTMFGVQGASSVLGKLANSIAKQISKNLARQALTKGTIYPIVKQVAKTVGIRMTKQIFADSLASAVPVIGSLASGGLTYVMFRPRCMKLRQNLMSYNLCDPDFYRRNS